MINLRNISVIPLQDSYADDRFDLGFFLSDGDFAGLALGDGSLGLLFAEVEIVHRILGDVLGGPLGELGERGVGPGAENIAAEVGDSNAHDCDDDNHADDACR